MSEPGQDALDPRRRRLLYRATHRGTKENDALIGVFVAGRIASFSPAELDALERLLEFPETELTDWLTGQQPAPPEADCQIFREIRDSLA
jgi:antitoxin CptB